MEEEILSSAKVWIIIHGHETSQTDKQQEVSIQTLECVQQWKSQM